MKRFIHVDFAIRFVSGVIATLCFRIAGLSGWTSFFVLLGVAIVVAGFEFAHEEDEAS